MRKHWPELVGGVLGGLVGLALVFVALDRHWV